MLTIKIFPDLKYLHSFLEVRGISFADHNPNILHYTGESIRELKACLKRDKPDLLIFHKDIPISKLPKGLLWVYQPFQTEKELYKTRLLYTNSHRLCQIYYQRLGIRGEIRVIQREIKEKKNESKFAGKLEKIKGRWERFSQKMLWI